MFLERDFLLGVVSGVGIGVSIGSGVLLHVNLGQHVSIVILAFLVALDLGALGFIYSLKLSIEETL